MLKHRYFTIAIIAILLAALIGQVYAATAPDMGDATTFAVLGFSTVTNTGSSVIRGDVGLSPNTSVTGFPPGTIVPPASLYVADAVAQGARNAAIAANTDLGIQPCDFYPTETNLGILSAITPLVPGVYCFESSASIGSNGTVNLDGTKPGSQVFIFRIPSTLTAGSNSIVVGAVDPCNIFWQVGSSATLDTTANWQGTIIADQSISMNNGATLRGRALALNGAVTLDNNTIDNVCSGLQFGGVGVRKIFSPYSIRTGNVSTLTITFTNANETVATLTSSFNDTLPDGVVVADVPNLATDCGGTPSIGAGGDTVTLPVGSTIPAAAAGIPGSCTLTVDVTSSTAGTYTNTILVDELITDQGAPVAPASAVLVVRSAATGDDDDDDEDSGLPAFPGTGSGAPIFNEVSPWNLLIIAGILATALIVGGRSLRRNNRSK